MASKRKTISTVSTFVERLMLAMDACARARGEAQWTNGYRLAPTLKGV